MNDWQGPTLAPDELAELREVVCADVKHLSRTWFERMDPHELRREAVILRRLLMDHGGDLARLWRAEVRDGTLRIAEVADLRRFPHWRGLGYAVAYPQNLNGVKLAELLMWRVEEAETPEIQAALSAEQQDADLSVQDFLASVCVVVNEKPVRRLDLITYIANRRGGAHFNRHSKSGDPRRRAAHDLLDELSRGGWAVNQRDAAFAQLISIGENVVKSRDVQALIAA